MTAYICATCRKSSPRLQFWREQGRVGYETKCCAARVLAIPYPDDDQPKETEVDIDTALFLEGM